MTNERALARSEDTQVIVWTDDKVQLLKEQIADPDATDSELELFMLVCDRKQMDPFSRQIYAVWRYDKRLGRKKMTIQTSIDGFRLIAERTDKFAGRVGPYWCGADGKWTDVWLKKEHPAAARVGVRKVGNEEPTFAVAHWDEYVQTFKDGNPSGLWANMPRQMIAKCAESQALRAAFPEELSGLYTSEEMQQADNTTPVSDSTPQPRSVQPRTPQAIAPQYDNSGLYEIDPETGEVLEGEWEEIKEPPITEGQTKMIAHLIVHVPDAERQPYLLEFGAQSIGTLTKRAASRVIDDLKKMEANETGEVLEPEEDAALMGYLQDLRSLGGTPNAQIMAQATGQRARRHVVVVIRDVLIEKVKAAESFDDLTNLEVDWKEHPGWTNKVKDAFDARSAWLAEAGVSA